MSRSSVSEAHPKITKVRSIVETVSTTSYV